MRLSHSVVSVKMVHRQKFGPPSKIVEKKKKHMRDGPRSSTGLDALLHKEVPASLFQGIETRRQAFRLSLVLVTRQDALFLTDVYRPSSILMQALCLLQGVSLQASGSHEAGGG